MATIHYTTCGLEYIYLVNVKLIELDGEQFVDLPPEEIFHTIAQAILKSDVPIRGREVTFLRKTLGMKKTEFAQVLGITSAGIAKWEAAQDKRLSKINQAAVRIVCAEAMGIEIDTRWASLSTESEIPKRLEVAA